MSSTQQHAKIYLQVPITKSCALLPSVMSPARTLVLVVIGSLGLGVLASCTEEQADRRADARTPSASTAPTEGGAPTQTAAPQVNSAVKKGSWYRVVAETAYFFDSPAQSKPNGKYLLRGDVLHGEEETNGFVKTRFKTPNGATVAGWLKTQELGKLAAVPTTRATPGTSSPRVASASAPAAPDTYRYELEEEANASAPVATTSTKARTAVVQVSKSYFYNSPDLSAPRKAHCVQGDKVRLGKEQGDAVYVTFTNWEKVTSSGWMRKEALRYLP